MLHHRHIGGTIGSLAALLVIVGLGAGCDSDSPPAPAPPITDMATLDPCGLIASNAFADMKSVGDAKTIGPSDFVRCDIDLPVVGKDDGRIALWTILDAHTADLTAPDAAASDRGSIHIVEGTSHDGAWCDATVRLTDGKGVELHATADQDGRRLTDVDTCRARDLAVDAIITTMRSGTYPRVTYPNDSLHGYDLCGSISLPQVEKTVDLTGLTDQSTPAEQDCQWRIKDGSDTPPGAMVSVMLDDPALYMGERTTIDGFPARAWDISQTHGTGRCVVTTVTKTWHPWPGRHHSDTHDTVSELLYTQVILPTQTRTGQACQAAESIATQALSHRAPK